jgi:molybdopterin-guanine dinucleotide biosynthesis protein A
MSFSAIILAGGKSSRMGRDKAFLEIDGRTLLERQVETARGAGAQEIFISGRVNADYSALQLPVLRDRFSNAGPLAGIHSALYEATYPMLLVLAVDLPNLTSQLLKRIKEEDRGELGIIPRRGEKIEPLAAFYPRQTLRMCEGLLQKQVYAVRAFAATCVACKLARFIDLPLQEEECFFNCNTPHDAKFWRSQP